MCNWEIKKRVEEIVDDFRTRDPFLISKRAKINILYRNIGNIKGFYRKIDNMKFIVLNENLSELLTKFVLCHELGHAFLHDDDFILDLKVNFSGMDSKIELEANCFAAYLLLDDESFYYPENNYEEQIIRDLQRLVT